VETGPLTMRLPEAFERPGTDAVYEYLPIETENWMVEAPLDHRVTVADPLLRAEARMTEEESPVNVIDQFVPDGRPVSTKVIANVGGDAVHENGALTWESNTDPEEKDPEMFQL
jgi:hypothetical protein